MRIGETEEEFDARLESYDQGDGDEGKQQKLFLILDYLWIWLL